ncbi:MAG: hypothetical protein VB108_06485 [Anaerolineaceae bacterium]|nr:hypothetical protein [Anaerolineaceae bacterium]
MNFRSNISVLYGGNIVYPRPLFYQRCAAKVSTQGNCVYIMGVEPPSPHASPERSEGSGIFSVNILALFFIPTNPTPTRHPERSEGSGIFSVNTLALFFIPTNPTPTRHPERSEESGSQGNCPGVLPFKRYPLFSIPL